MSKTARRSRRARSAPARSRASCWATSSPDRPCALSRERSERFLLPRGRIPAMPGEFDFIQWVRAQQARSDLVQIPAGDDLAVLKWPADELLSVGVDQVLDGVHFNSDRHSPRAIGRKAM